MPESRLLRVETEQADTGRPILDRVVRDILEELFLLAARADEDAESSPYGYADALGEVVANANGIDEDIALEARELASVEHTIPNDDSDDSDDGEGVAE